jgi:hypothetical protein
MRILVANWHRQIVGGVETYLQTLIPALGNCGHQVSLVYGGAALPSQTTIDHPDAHMTTWEIGESGTRSTLESIAEWKPDLAFVHGLNSTELEGTLLERYPAALFATTITVPVQLAGSVIPVAMSLSVHEPSDLCAWRFIFPGAAEDLVRFLCGAVISVKQNEMRSSFGIDP